jgi:hypothetical protein
VRWIACLAVVPPRGPSALRGDYRTRRL